MSTTRRSTLGLALLSVAGFSHCSTAAPAPDNSEASAGRGGTSPGTGGASGQTANTGGSTQAGSSGETGGVGGTIGEAGAAGVSDSETGGSAGSETVGGTAGATASAGSGGSAGAPLSEYRGYWEGSSSQNQELAFHVTADGTVPDFSIRLRLSLAGGSCTATFVGAETTIANAMFLTTAAASGISVTPEVSGTFTGETTATGTYSGHSGSFTVVCGTSIAFGTGSILSPGTFTASRVSSCGNGAVETGEECEMGAGCDENCQRVQLCGDGFVDAPESCDDNNTMGGDGCGESCVIEPIAVAYPGGLPLAGQSLSVDSYDLFEVTGLLPGVSYEVSTTSSQDVDIFVYDDEALEAELCDALTSSGNESCSAAPTTSSLFVVVNNYDAQTASYSLDVTEEDLGFGGAGGF